MKPWRYRSETVLHRRAVHFGDQPARHGEGRAIETGPITDRDKLMRRLARMIAAPAADMDAEFGGQLCQPALQCSDHARGDAGGMPVHPHHRTERLEPERMRQPAQQLVTAIFENDRFGDHRAQPGHAIAQPFRHAATVQRQVGTAGATRHQCISVDCGMTASAASNSGSSPAALTGT